jgi:hypothetical protein
MFNRCLVISAVVAYGCYVAVLTAFESTVARPIYDYDGTTLIAYDLEFGGLAALDLACVAVMLFLLMHALFATCCSTERWFAPRPLYLFRRRAWRVLLVLAWTIPFIPAATHLVRCLCFPDSYDTTPIIFTGPQGL